MLKEGWDVQQTLVGDAYYLVLCNRCKFMIGWQLASSYRQESMLLQSCQDDCFFFFFFFFQAWDTCENVTCISTLTISFGWHYIGNYTPTLWVLSPRHEITLHLAFARGGDATWAWANFFTWPVFRISVDLAEIWLFFCRANAQQPKLFVGMILILIFAEALALYGLIVGIILSSRAGQSRAD